MLLHELVETSNTVSATSSRTEKVELLAILLKRLDPGEAQVAVSYLSGHPVQSPLGVGYSAVYAVEESPAEAPRLEVSDVDRVLEDIANTSGPGSKAKRAARLSELFAAATEPEQEFLRGLILRNLRQGALEGVMAEAVAQAIGVPAPRVSRAAMLEGDLTIAAAKALIEGPESLADAGLELLTPLQPMLAKTAQSVTEALDSEVPMVVEQKLDGLRLQVHKDGEKVRVFSRNLRDVTADMNEVVAEALAFDADQLILDGEGLLVDDSGVPMSFQDSMSNRVPGRPETFGGYYFDVLHHNGEDLIDLPLEIRRARLEEVVPKQRRVASIVTNNPEEGERFFSDSVANGFEGVVVKDLEQPYAAGRRGSGWRKVKPTHTLDLVILAVEWGSGRRQGWLSNLHLGARDGDSFVMLGKTFKGLTDEMLEWQTTKFLALEASRDGHVVFVKPEVVYEIAFDGVQRSTRYPGGVALRFARVKGYREDKSAAEADTLEVVRSFLK